MDVCACVNEHCRAAHSWAHAYVRVHLPQLLAAVRRLLQGETWDVDPTTLPSLSQATLMRNGSPATNICLTHLLHRHWVGHAEYPVPLIIAHVCKHFYSESWPTRTTSSP